MTYYGTDAPLNRMPVLTCDPKSAGSIKGAILNQDCFAAPAIGQYGGQKYPYMANAAFIENDLALYKTFADPGQPKRSVPRLGIQLAESPIAAVQQQNQLTLRYTRRLQHEGNHAEQGRRLIDLGRSG